MLKVGDKVWYATKKLRGMILTCFWADAGDPKEAGYVAEAEHQRYYVSTPQGVYTTPEKSLIKLGGEN